MRRRSLIQAAIKSRYLQQGIGLVAWQVVIPSRGEVGNGCPLLRVDGPKGLLKTDTAPVSFLEEFSSFGVNIDVSSVLIGPCGWVKERTRGPLAWL
jgi:hypothetical protein